MKPVNVSLRKIHGGTVCAFSSQLDDAHPAAAVLADDGYWSSQKSNSIVSEYITIDYADALPVDCIEIGASPAGRVTFPQDFRLEASVDGRVWRVVQSERKYELEDGPVYRLDLPLALTRFIRLYITRPRKTGAKFFSEIGSIRAGIGGAREVRASSHSSYEHAPAKLLDGSDGTYWESEIRTGPSREYVEIDLGRTLQVNGVWLSSTGIIPHGFPESYSIEVSADRTVWAPLVEEKFFSAQPATTYFHEAAVTPARYVRVEMGTVPIEAKTFGARLAGFAVSAAPFAFTHTHNIGELTPRPPSFRRGWCASHATGTIRSVRSCRRATGGCGTRPRYSRGWCSSPRTVTTGRGLPYNRPILASSPHRNCGPGWSGSPMTGKANRALPCRPTIRASPRRRRPPTASFGSVPTGSTPR